MSPSSIAFIVDGHMEQDVVQHYCKDVPVRRLNCNSDDMPAETVAKPLAALIGLLNRAKHIFVVLDREGRPQSAAQFGEEVSKALADRNVDLQRLRVVVADRETENWLLADVESLKQKSYIRRDVSQRDFEGQGGKRELQKMMQEGRRYHETVEGVELFKCIRPQIAAQNSASFRRLVEVLRDHCPLLSSVMN